MALNDRKQEARERRRAQRERVRELRNRVVAISLIAFVLLWGVVFTQMVTGNDPVLGARPKTTAPRVASEAIETTAPEEVEAIEPEPLEVEEEAVEVEPEPEPAPVTTSQS